MWLAVKVGALSYGGGYVIIPLMYGDAVEAHRWMSEQEFANAVAYGQITPGPVTHTVALVGYAATGFARRARRHGGRVRALVRDGHARRAPLRAPAHQPVTRARFLDGAGPAAAGAILGAAVPLARALEDALAVARRARRRGRARCCASPPIYVLIGGALIGRRHYALAMGPRSCRTRPPRSSPR